MTLTNDRSRSELPAKGRNSRFILPAENINRLKTEFTSVLAAILPRTPCTREAVSFLTRVDERLAGPRMLGYLSVTGKTNDPRLARQVYGTDTPLNRFYVRKKMELFVNVGLVIPCPSKKKEYILLPRGYQAVRECRKFLVGLVQITRTRARALHREYTSLFGP